jgi:hypothetical protein
MAKKVEAISKKQITVIWAIAKKSLQMDRDMLYSVIHRMFDKESMKELNAAEAELLIRELKRNAAGLSVDALTEPQYRKIMGMAAEFGWTAHGLRQFIEKEVGVGDVKWLDVQQARIVITGLEKIRSWQHEKEVAKEAAEHGV